MPGRTLQSTSNYRYSINGQEKSPEIATNTTTAEFWQYDSRIGRRWNIDPKPIASISVYVSFNNNPIINIDIDGDTSIIKPNRVQYSKDRTEIVASIETNIIVKILNVSKRSEVKSYITDFVNSKRTIFKSGKTATYIKYDHKGKTMPKNTDGSFQQVTVSGDIKITISFVQINSINDIKPGDDVLIYGDNLSSLAKDMDGLAFGKNLTLVDSKARDRHHTVLHEILHTLGLWDLYKKGPNGPTSNGTDNIMDLNGGYEINEEQAGIMIAELIDDRGRRMAKENLYNTLEMAKEPIKKLFK
jgi:hypothetical protein